METTREVRFRFEGYVAYRRDCRAQPELKLPVSVLAIRVTTRSRRKTSGTYVLEFPLRVT